VVFNLSQYPSFPTLKYWIKEIQDVSKTVCWHILKYNMPGWVRKYVYQDRGVATIEATEAAALVKILRNPG